MASNCGGNCGCGCGQTAAPDRGAGQSTQQRQAAAEMQQQQAGGTADSEPFQIAGFSWWIIALLLGAAYSIYNYNEQKNG